MSLVRATALKDATSTGNAVTTADVSSGKDLSTLFSAGQSICAGIHLMDLAAGGTLLVTVQSASSSGFSTKTTEILSSAMSSEQGKWESPVAVTSTDRKWFRCVWTPNTTGDFSRFLSWVSFK